MLELSFLIERLFNNNKEIYNTLSFQKLDLDIFYKLILTHYSIQIKHINRIVKNIVLLVHNLNVKYLELNFY